MAYTLPNGSTIDTVASWGDAVVVTSISNANPAVATVPTGHSVVEGDILLLNVGWGKLNNRVVRVSAQTATTLTFQDIDTTNLTSYPVGVSGGSAKVAATWAQINQVINLEFSGGEQQNTEVQFLESATQVQVPTVKSAIGMTLTVADDPLQAYNAIIRKYDDTKETTIVRLNLVNGQSIAYPSMVTMSETPSVTINEILANTIAVAVQANPTRYARG